MLPGKSGFFLFCPHLEINLKYPFRHKTSAVPESSAHLHNLLKDNKKTTISLLVFHNRIRKSLPGQIERFILKTD